MIRVLGPALVAFAVLAFAAASNARAQDEEAKKKAAKNMKELALALINCHDSFGRFPPVVYHIKDGKPNWSWRVQILPFIERDDLFTQFIKKNEPWDSEYNKKLMEKMPEIFAPVTGKPKEKNTTHYRMIDGGGALLDGIKKVTLQDIKERGQHHHDCGGGRSRAVDETGRINL
jgi:hypothetical protein